MRGSTGWLLGAGIALAGIALGAWWWWGQRPPSPEGAQGPAPGVLATARVRLESVGPRLLSNETAQPLTLYGRALPEGAVLVLEGPRRLELPTVTLDGDRRAAVLPDGIDLGDAPEARFTARLRGPDGAAIAGEAPLVVVNDRAWPTLWALETDAAGRWAFVSDLTTDALHRIDLSTGALTTTRPCDRPRALARWDQALVIVCEYSPEVIITPMASPEAPTARIPLPLHAQHVLVDEARALAYVTGRLTDRVHVLDLSAARALTTLPAGGVDPRTMALGRDTLAVGNLGSSDLSLFALAPDGRAATQPPTAAAPDPTTAIIGGLTARYQKHIMGGKAPRDLAYSPRLDAFLVSSIGPNIGPNPDRMEVSMNSGVTVVDRASGRHLRHVSMRRGVGEGLALDDANGLLYLADIGMGRVLAFDVQRLASDEEAATAIVAAVELPVPEDTPWLRPAADLGIQGRATRSLHAGPRALRLLDGGRRLLVLDRFVGEVVALDLTGARDKAITVARRYPLGVPMQTQPDRRLGEIAYYTDLGNSRMSCDACHYEGHVEGVLFTKNLPMHIYRTPSLRWVRETPPYFTPALFPDLQTTARLVGARNRYHNPDPDEREVQALAAFQAALTGPPNPYRRPDGGLPASITLPDGRTGDPAAGMALFFGEAACAACHPPPHFTTDQDPATRRELYKVGTPVTLNAQLHLQDAAPYALPAPSLLGAWDNFPLLHSGRGGFDAAPRGQVAATAPFALREVLTLARENDLHGRVKALTAQQEDDLLAFLLTL